MKSRLCDVNAAALEKLPALTGDKSGVKQLWVIDVETGRSRQLTRGSSDARNAAWSPRLLSY